MRVLRHCSRCLALRQPDSWDFMNSSAHRSNVIDLALATCCSASLASRSTIGSLPFWSSFRHRSASSRASRRPIVLSLPRPIWRSLPATANLKIQLLLICPSLPVVTWRHRPPPSGCIPGLACFTWGDDSRSICRAIPPLPSPTPVCTPAERRYTSDGRGRVQRERRYLRRIYRAKLDGGGRGGTKSWRKGWDSNPRGSVTPCRFSRPVP